MQTATLIEARQRLGRDAFVVESPPCPTQARWCFELALHVVEEDGADVQTPQWVADQVREANRLFAPIDVGFRVGSAKVVDARFASVETRLDRDLLGRDEHSLGVVHVFVVRRLADVDVPGEVIRGVHWRDRVQTSRRWVILSSIASSLVLAHELGHFFGLPHSKHRKSLMNKSPHLDPPWHLRTFPEEELAIMRRRRDAMVEDGTLVKANVNAKPAAPPTLPVTPVDPRSPADAAPG
ncbi:matrixin family metalloprotease [Paraliomyxa miuraensis]|uniref:matrixin family metalloprotease n=1 Tax=Paraliomyxa miuraensis TaxID=376150 RepID=UPI00225222E6|nr:matrixin family metalloprotease [Paraliomyxa miuraensis]